MRISAQNPEISLREFASGQIKKGVRSIGMGGDGATWGNYALVWKDSGTALADAGVTTYTNGNTFSFNAVGYTSPALWHGLTLYAIALSQNAIHINTTLKFPYDPKTAFPYTGDGNNQALFVKAAMPLGHGFSAGILLSYETSQFAGQYPDHAVNYHTTWLPTGGLGFTWQPDKKWLIGFRALFNHDNEERIENRDFSEKGINLSYEYRLGVSYSPLEGTIIDAGGNYRYRFNGIYNTSGDKFAPNIGVEQALYHKHFFIRAGLDETSPTAGLSFKFKPFTLDLAYVRDLGKNRIGSIFGSSSNSIIATLVYDYEK